MDNSASRTKEVPNVEAQANINPLALDGGPWGSPKALAGFLGPHLSSVPLQFLFALSP